MIKVVTFEFEPLDIKREWCHFASFGALKKFDTKLFKGVNDLELKLDPNDSYQIGLDQSTGCTGCFIKNYANTFAAMIEINRNKNTTANDFIFDFELIMHKLFEGMIVSHLIYEKPVLSETFRSSQVLFQLEGSIQLLGKRYSEFRPTEVDCVVSSSWRKAVILEECKHYLKAPDRDEKKKAAELTFNRIYPWTQYYGASIGKDRDIFEAMGVLFGWFMTAFDPLGRPYARGEKFNGVIGGFILPGMDANTVAQEFRKLGIDSLWVVQNPGKSIYENMACAVKKYKVVCLEFNSLSAMLALCIESNFKWMNPEIMTVVLVAANFVDSRVFEITGKEFNFVV